MFGTPACKPPLPRRSSAIQKLTTWARIPLMILLHLYRTIATHRFYCFLIFSSYINNYIQLVYESMLLTTFWWVRINSFVSNIATFRPKIDIFLHCGVIELQMLRPRAKFKHTFTNLDKYYVLFWNIMKLIWNNIDFFVVHNYFARSIAHCIFKKVRIQWVLS